MTLIELSLSSEPGLSSLTSVRSHSGIGLGLRPPHPLTCKPFPTSSALQCAPSSIDSGNHPTQWSTWGGESGWVLGGERWPGRWRRWHWRWLSGLMVLVMGRGSKTLGRGWQWSSPAPPQPHPHPHPRTMIPHDCQYVKKTTDFTANNLATGRDGASSTFKMW